MAIPQTHYYGFVPQTHYYGLLFQHGGTLNPAVLAIIAALAALTIASLLVIRLRVHG